MTKRKSQGKSEYTQSSRVPYYIIKRAMQGDEDSLEQILHHYRPRINYLVATAVWRAGAKSIDITAVEEIENDFLLAVLKFRDLTD